MQGSVKSLLLFNVYLDKLLKNKKNLRKEIEN